MSKNYFTIYILLFFSYGNAMEISNNNVEQPYHVSEEWNYTDASRILTGFYFDKRQITITQTENEISAFESHFVNSKEVRISLIQDTNIIKAYYNLFDIIFKNQNNQRGTYHFK